MRTFTRAYREYELLAVEQKPLWDVQIVPTSTTLPQPPPEDDIVSDANFETALLKAKQRVDALLKK